MELLKPSSPVFPKFGKSKGDNTLARLKDVNLVIEGKVDVQNYKFETGFDADCQSQMVELRDTAKMVDGTLAKFVQIVGEVIIDGNGINAIKYLGTLTVNDITPFADIVASSTIVEAEDVLFRTVYTALNPYALVEDNDPISPTFGQVIPVGLMFINLDPLFSPFEYTIWLISNPGVLQRERINVNVTIAVPSTASVSYTTN